MTGTDSDAPTAVTLRDRGEEARAIVGVLVAVAGPLAGRAWVVRDGENSLGRDSGCDVSFPEDDGRISRRHAMLVHREGEFGLEPLGSSPTRLDLVKLEKGPIAPLHDGAKLHLGWTEFVFRTLPPPGP